jgi:hypothetical protein
LGLFKKKSAILVHIYNRKKIIENRNFFADVNDPLVLRGLTRVFLCRKQCVGVGSKETIRTASSQQEFLSYIYCFSVDRHCKKAVGYAEFLKYCPIFLGLFLLLQLFGCGSTTILHQCGSTSGSDPKKRPKEKITPLGLHQGFLSSMVHFFRLSYPPFLNRVLS